MPGPLGAPARAGAGGRHDRGSPSDGPRGVTTTSARSATTSPTTGGTTDVREFGYELWEYLTGRQATVEYAFEDMEIEVPKTTGPDSPRATWRLDGTVRVRTADKDNAGSAGAASSGNGRA